MAALELFANQAQTTITSGGATTPASGTSETWTASSSSGFPAASSSASPPSFFRITDVALSTEKMIVTNVSGTTWTVTRGAEGTTPVSHASGFTVQNVATAASLGGAVQLGALRNRGGVAASTAYAPGDLVAYNGQHALVTAAVTASSWSAWNSPPTLTGGTYLPTDGSGVWYAADWGVKGDAGGTDNGPLLNRALAAMWGSGLGGFLVLPYGDIGSWLQVSTTVIIPPKCILVGQGVEGTMIKLASGSNADVIQFMTYNSTSQATILSAATGATIAATSLENAFYAGLMNLAVDGHAFGQASTAYFSAVNMTTNPTSSTAGSDPDFDPSNILFNVEMTDASGDGLTHVGRGQLRVTNCISRYNVGWGAVPSFDSLYVGNNFGENGIGGAYITFASCNGAANKIFNSGQNPAWVASTPYAARTAVMYSGGLYVSKNSITSATNPSSDTTNWSHITGVTAPAYWGCGLVFDGTGENSWEGTDCQQNSASDFYLHSTTGVRVSGVSHQPNYNQVTDLQNGTNPSNYVSLVLDGATGCQADLVGTILAAGSVCPVKIINSATGNEVHMTGDTGVTNVTSADSAALTAGGNTVFWNGVPVFGSSMTSIDPTTSNQFNMIGQSDGAQYSNFNLCDTAVPDTSGQHYWSFSHRATGHGLLIYNWNGTAYTNVLQLAESGLVSTVHNTLDDGSGNATVTGTLTVGSGIADAEQFTCLASSYTLTNSTSAQKLFNATTNGAFTAAATMSYFFEAEFDITGLSGSSHTVSFGFGGTATYTSVKYLADVLSPFTAGTFASWPRAVFTAATAQTMAAASTSTSIGIRLRGMIRVNGAGTVIPQVTQGTASAAAVVSANSWIRFTPVGSNTVADVGSWS